MHKASWGMLFAACLVVSTSAFGQQGEARILAAREAIRTGDRNTLERLAQQPDTHLLDPYVRYWLLLNKLARPEAPPATELADFLMQEAGSVLAERLRADWLRRLAKDSDWAGFLRLYPDLQNPDGELRCHHWTARLMNGDRGVLSDVAAQWHELTDAHSACDTVLRAAVSSGVVSTDDAWWRFRRQVESRNTGNARSTLAWLDGGDSNALEQAIKSPAQYLDRLPANFATDRGSRELALAALVRLVRDDMPAAHARLIRLQDRLGADDRAYVYSALALRASWAQDRMAMDWFDAAGDIPMTAEQRAWRVRSALRNSDWKAVLTAIDKLNADEQKQPEWIYWRARGLAATNHRSEAEALYARIAGEPHFYGMLAGDELGRPFAVSPHATALSTEQLRRAEEDLGLRRAIALFQLDMRTEAVREWNWSLRNQDEAFRLAAARLALKYDIFDRAINTAELASPNGAYDLRFLTPYRDLIEPQVRSQGLDMSWVYGLMRQESRFVVPARSSSGAQGLMQVMPATGKWVAGKIGMSGYHAGLLAEPNTNVQLGTSYMRLILEDLDNHPVLASAGYNAGPGRAKRWRDERPLEGAIYAETIPFDETRDYVKKVMANTVIYAAMLDGRPQSLKARLGTIAPRPDAR
ncbi:MAG: transglycosylase SLT domain-containing protein [Azoarcus sp.]|nr:lytic transglycosylase domain-containing protein [Azoarcus sp.]MDD2872647.1 transglycosylase SLT domain-containing protein [Azoarcus sp.]MDX9836256.1 transglycosylase SLT domain-containing protein [Azoarcus sp.]